MEPFVLYDLEMLLRVAAFQFLAPKAFLTITCCSTTLDLSKEWWQNS